MYVIPTLKKPLQDLALNEKGTCHFNKFKVFDIKSGEEKNCAEKLQYTKHMMNRKVLKFLENIHILMGHEKGRNAAY